MLAVLSHLWQTLTEFVQRSQLVVFLLKHCLKFSIFNTVFDLLIF